MTRLAIVLAGGFLLIGGSMGAQCNLRLSAITKSTAAVAIDGPIPEMTRLDVEVTDISGSLAGFNVFADGVLVPGSPFQYHLSGTTPLKVSLSTGVEMHQIFIHDVTDVGCTAIIPVQVVIDTNPAKTAYHPTGIRRLIIYPNPLVAGESFTLSGLRDEDNGKNGLIKVISIRGEIIESTNVSCSNMIFHTLPQSTPPGNYTVSLEFGTNLYSGILVIR